METVRKTAVLLALLAGFAAQADVGQVPGDGVYNFVFGVETAQGGFAVPASAVCDVKGTGYYDGSDSATFSYGFLGTTDTSYIDDAPTGTKVTDANMIDGFTVVKGQKIVLRNTEDKNGLSCVAGPFAKDYLPAGASSYEGRYPVRFTMRAEERAYYAVTCTVANASADANADVTLYAERSRIIAHHMTLNPGETRTFAWSVELAPQYCKIPADYYKDDAVNVAVVGENAALASLTVVKQPQKAGKVRGNDVANMNDGKTMWICTDSTGCDYGIATPFFSLVNYAGVGAAVARWMPADIAIVNQGERGLSTANGVHRAACLLKPGDYLYVEYGHNDNSVESYTKNLEAYLSDATAAGANLIIVSPIERHNTWDSENLVWKRSLQGYAEVGEAWVKAKIDEGSRNVAFVDLNKPYAEWMNAETDRICEKNSSIARNAAINFYYRSAKGSAVDATHENTAGADHAAYIFWQNALERVAAGEGAEEGSYEKVQADVLKGITDGYKAKLGIDSDEDNTPWNVSDEIIAAGGAPNSFWDETVKAGFDFANDVAVANVAATVDQEGVVTISGATLRVLNSGVYYKAVVDIVGADGTVTNRYWSFSNYDTTGCEGGTTVNPEKPGFISADLASGAEPGDAFSEILSVPAGGKAYLWFAKADESTWQVGGNGPSSAIYPIEAWTDVLVDDDCSNVSTWAKFTDAVHTFQVSEDGDYIAFTSTAKASNGYHAPGFFYLTLPSDGKIDGGRVRVTFKTLYNSGNLHFIFANALGSKTKEESIVPNALDMLVLSDAKATVFGSSATEITLSAEETPVTQNNINGDFWMDVDMILDFDTFQASVSVGGSDYKEYTIPAPTMPFNYFGIRPWTYSTHDGAIDDVKIVALAPTPQVTVAASANNAAFGSVAINGTVAAEATAFVGSDVALTAVSADSDLYAFDHWEDAEGNNVSTKQTLVIEAIAADCAYTAVFREYGHDENRVVTWDISAYQGDFEVVPSSATTITDNGMTFYLTSGDTMTADGLVWKDSAISKNTDTLGGSAHHIEFTPAATGTLTLKFSVDSYNSSRKPTMLIKAADSAGECGSGNGDVTVVTAAAGTEYTLSANLTAGTKYFIWTYAYNWSAAGFHHNYTIPSITYTYIPVFDATFDVADGETSVRANVIANNANVTKSGTGTLVLLGNSDFSGSLFVNAGTLKLGTPTDIPGATADFDVSAENAVETINEVLTWKDSLPGSENTLVNAGVQPEFVEEASTMNGRPALKGASFRMDMDSAISAKTTILAMHPFCGTTSWNVLMVDDESYSITCRNSSPWNRKGSGNKDYYGTDGIWQNGVDVDGKTQTTPMVMSIVGQWTKSDPACINIGWNNSSGTQAYSELLTYSRELAEAERVAVEEYLMSKWGIGNVAYAPIPASAGVEIATGATLDLGGMTQTVASLSVAVGGVVTNGTLIVASAPSIDEQAFAAATDNGDGTWTVVWKDVDIEVDTHSFVWNWNVASGDWNNPANWLYEGKVQATTYPCDAESDYATFTTPATVTLTDAAAVKEAWFNANVTLTGGTLTTTLAATYENSGKVTLSNAGFANPKNLAATVSCPIVMAADTVNWFNKVSDGDWKDWMTVSGNISGEGRYNVNLANVQGNGIKFTGNNNDFHGDVYTSGGKWNRSVINWSENAVGTNTFLHIGHSYGTYNSDDYRMGAAVKFGGVDGGWWDRYDGALLTIGYLNRDSVINISNGVGGRANSVAKVGNANLTLGTTTIKNLTVFEGSVTMPVGIAPQTLTIATGTKIYIPAGDGWAEGESYDLFSYTTLAGEGTLVDQVEVTGLAQGLVAKIAVADKTVTATIEAAVPATDDENATITKNEGGTYTVEVKAETVAITVPDGVTVSEVVVSPDTATVTGVPASATVKVAVSWDGGSAKYEIVNIGENGAVALDEDAVVTVGEEQIPLKPVLSDASDEVLPFIASGSAVDVGVKAIPGLTYRLLRGGSLESINTPVAECQATSSRVSLQDETLLPSSAFYCVGVDLQ